MMWHFYEIPYIPDLELVKYQSLGEQGIDGIAVKLVPVLKSLTSSQPHDTTSMVHVQELPQRNMNLPESILIKRWGMLALLAVLIRISVANDG